MVENVKVHVVTQINAATALRPFSRNPNVWLVRSSDTALFHTLDGCAALDDSWVVHSATLER